MKTFKDNRTAYFDVDDTLLEWVLCGPYDVDAVKIENKGHVFYKRELCANTKALRNQKMSGNTVVVWSAGGAEWAATVVRALGLEDYVDVCLTKPDFYYDDKDVNTWFPTKRYFKEKEKQED
jgi:phosphoserine phosphatase